MDNPAQAGVAPRRADAEERGASAPSRLAVLLVGNYELDRQESMLRFAAVIEKQLAAMGVEVTSIRPEPFFGRLRSGTRGLGKWLAYLDKFLIFPSRLKRQIRKLRDGNEGRFVVHICDHSNAMYVAAAQGTPVVTTCHDLLAVRGALGEDTDCPASFAGKYLQRWILRGLSRAAIVACNSSPVKADADRLLPSGARTRVVLLGLNHSYHPVPRAEADTRLAPITGLHEHFILHVGSNLRRKNREGVLRIFARVAPRWPGQLVFAGQRLSPELLELAASLGISERILEVVKPDNETLQALYNRAAVFLYPSRFEGFPWPVVEAQACGCPVVCSRAGPFTEVAGGSALLRDVDDEDGLAEDVLKVVGPGKREHWSGLGLANAKRFTAERMVVDYVRAYREAITAGNPSPS